MENQLDSVTEKPTCFLRLQGLACDWSKHNKHSRNIFSVRGYFCFLVCRVQKLHKSWMQYRLSDGKYAPCLTGLSFETFRGEKFLTASATFGVKAGN